MSETLSKHELFQWIGNCGHDSLNPGLPHALALDLQIMLRGLEAKLDATRRVLKAEQACWDCVTYWETHRGHWDEAIDERNAAYGALNLVDPDRS